MTYSVGSEENFDRELEARLLRDRERTFSTVSSTARAWLALVPAWTAQLAGACQFPTGAADLSTFFQIAEQAGLAQGSGADYFWMPEAMRAMVLSDLRKAQSGSRDLIATAAEIGQKILSAREKIPVSPMVSCWAELAARCHMGLEETSNFFISTVKGLVENGRRDTGSALTWLSAGKSLAVALGGPLESAVRVGEHRIELTYRKEQDERHLNHLLPREDQVAAFKYLMENREGVWALHYVGMGGVGKTMMLRHITARLAPEYQAATSRVDFDFLNPDYPVRLPGQLLLELATELQAYITNTSQEHKYGLFQAKAIALHESLSTAPPPEDPLANIRSPGFAEMMQIFCDFLSLLPGPKVLILDTCEELAKAQLSAGKFPVLDATFEIIEQICKGDRNTRIVFAGRRLLAKGGRNWRASGSDDAVGKGYLPEMKDYLALHEVFGFNEREARTFLREIEGLSLTDSLEQAIFSRSREAGVVGKIIRVPPRPVSNEVRYNPFDLSLYAEWVKADPRLDETIIASGQIDPYVENRIVQRVKNPHVQALLPSVVLLGRFNKEMLLPAMAGSPEEFEAAFRELTDQEWIDLRRIESIEESFLEVNRNLYDRLYGYYADPSRRTALDVAGKKLWPNLAQLVRELPLGQLGVDHVDAALRLTPIEEGATLWDDLNQRITNEGNWNWGQQVTALILGDDGAIGNSTHPLRAAVLATQAVATFHQNSSVDQKSTWEDIGKLASNHPNPQTASWLALRSRMKSLADPKFVKVAPSKRWSLFRGWISEVENVFNELSAEASQWSYYHRDQLVASFCATIETCLENTDPETEWGLRSDDVISVDLPGRIKTLTESQQLIAFAHNLVGRALARKDRWREARQLMDRAEELATTTENPSPAWEDWRAPGNFVNRIRLEVLTTIPPRIRTLLEQVKQWQDEAIDHLDQIDCERLVSLILQRTLAYRVLPEWELLDLANKEKYVLERRPVCAAHRTVPPLAVSLVMGWLALGRGDIAIDYLNRRREVALHTRKDPDTVRQIEHAKIRVLRRLRLQGAGAEIINRMVQSENEDDIIRVRELLALISSTDSEALLRLDRNASPAVLHAWWRGRVTLSVATATEPVERMKGLGARLMAEAEKADELNAKLAHFKIDWQEASLLASRHSLAPLSNPKDFVFSGNDWWGNHPTRTEEGLALEARTSALEMQPNLSRRMIDQVGPRLVAEICLEEAELMALRLPKQAAFLLDESYKLFVEAKDYFGAFIAMLLSAIADMHDGNVYRARQRVTDTLLPVYEYLETNKPDLKLPTSAQIDTFLKDPIPENAKPLDHPWLNGWIQRLVQCRLWVMADKGIKWISTEKVRKWLKNSFGEHLPIELALVSEYVTRQRGFSLSRMVRLIWSFSWPIMGCTFIGTILLIAIYLITLVVSVLSAPLCSVVFVLPLIWLAVILLKPVIIWIRDARRIPVGVTISLGIALFFVLFWGFFSVLGFLLEPGSRSPGFTPIGRAAGPYLIPIVALMATLLGVSYLFRKRFEAWRTSHATVNLELVPDSSDGIAQPEGSALTLTMTMRYVVRPVFWLLPLFPHRREEQEVKDHWDLPSLTSYQETARSSPFAILAEFSRLEEKLRDRKLPVELRISQSLVHFPWEAVLILGSTREKDSKLQFWRSGDALPANKIVTNDSGVNVLGNETWSLMIQKGWEPLTSKPEIRDYSTRLDPKTPRRVLHLIGQPVETSAGLRLMSRESRDELLPGTDELPITSSAVVVVQPEPVSDLMPRQETDRMEAGKLRMFANDVFTAGAPTVIVLPTLPPSIAESVLRILASRLATSQGSNLQVLLASIAEIRETIRNQSVYQTPTEREAFAGTNEQLKQELNETRLELALDVCLYARPYAD